MKEIVECVPNFSEGKDKAVIAAIAAAISSVKDVKLLDVDSGEDFNRTVYTFVGTKNAIVKAAFEAAKVGTALIDMRKHKGEHARMGALDVCPFIPISGVKDKDCIELSKEFGKKMAKELDIPIFLYAKSAKKPERIKLPDIRKGEYEALEEKFKDPSFKPDFGKSEFVPKSGATATGCRDILLAYNINLNTKDKKIASDIAGKIRTSGIVKKDKDGNKVIGTNGKTERIPGKFKGVQAGGMMYNENIAQVSMNLLNYRNVNLHHVYEEVKKQAKKYNVEVTGSEIVGLVPKESLIIAGEFYSKKENKNFSDEKEIVDLAIEKLGLSDLGTFKAKEKVIEYMIEEKDKLESMKIYDFLDELASSSPAPGGGSVAALSGGLGAALSSMACNLTIGKEKYADVQEDIKIALKESEKIRVNLTKLIDEDTKAFNDVIKAFKMPKDTEAQKKKRSNAIQEGYKKAAKIPLKTACECYKIFDVAKIVAEKGNANSITDAAVSAIMTRAGVNGAVLNVKINLSSINDEKFISKTNNKLSELEEKTNKKIKDILEIVNKKI